MRELIDRHVPGALVTGFESLILGITLPDPDDRHVVAARDTDARRSDRPRNRFGFEHPIEVMTELIAKHHEASASL